MSKHGLVESAEELGERTARAADAVQRLTRWHDDFPSPGVRFADLTPVFADAAGFHAVIDCLGACAPDAEVVAAAVVLELSFLGGRSHQGDYPLTSIVRL